MRGKVVALVGAQTGSEAKGCISEKIRDQFQIHIRTGGANAGHTHFYNGDKFVARSVPCGWTNPEANLIIGPGAVVDLQVLEDELRDISTAGYEIAHRLYIDEKAGIVTHAQHHGEGGVNGVAHQKIGSTGEGIGLSRMARINRGALLDDPRLDFVSVGDVRNDVYRINPDITVTDTSLLVNEMIDFGANVLLEGTQGQELSVIHGPHPFTTSADTGAGQLAVDAGISPSLVTETILVARTYPIRVAGNSGPLSGETTFDAIGVSEERTTVTKKIRRVGTWDSEIVKKAVRLNRPAVIAVTFLNYLFPDTLEIDDWDALPVEVLEWIDQVTEDTGAEVVAVGTSPDHHVAIKPGFLSYG